MTATRSIVLVLSALGLLAATLFVAKGLFDGGGDGAGIEGDTKLDRGAEATGAREPGGAAPRTGSASPSAGASVRAPEAGRDPSASRSEGGERARESSLTGRVVDPSGAVVVGARARVRSSDGASSASGDTDETGRFRIGRALDGDGFELVVHHPDFLPLTVPDLTLAAAGSLDLGDVTLFLGARIRGTVSDTSGAPVAGATVRLVSPGFVVESEGDVEAYSPAAKTTGPDGVFEFSGLTGGDHFLTASAPGHVSVSPPPVQVKENGLTNSVRIQMPIGSVVSGRVIGPDGEAIEGASVRVSGGASTFLFTHSGKEATGGAKTDASGYFEIREAPSGPCTVTVRADGFAPAEESTTGGSTELVLTLDRMGSIQGLVVDAATGDPVSDFEAWAESDAGHRIVLGNSMSVFGGGGESRVRVENSKDGRFLIEGLDPGTFVVRVRAKGSAPGKSDPVTVAPAPAVAETVIRLERGGSVVGVVREEGTGKPVEGATVRAMPSKGGGESDEEVTVFTSGAGMHDSDELFATVVGEATTGTTGAFSLEELPQGTYRIVVRHPDRARGDLAGVAVSAGVETGPLTIVLGAAGGIEGYVTGLSGEPVAGAQVTARNSKGLSRTVKTDAEGYYEIVSLSPGPYSVKRESESMAGMRFVSVMRRAGGGDDLPKPDGVAIEVSANQVTRVDFSDADLAAVAGRVLDGDAPVAGGAVQLSRRGAFALPLMARTDDDGAFEYERLDPGTYVLELRMPPDQRPIVSEVLELSAGRRIEKELVLPTGAIEGTVLDKLTHDPIEGAKVEIESLDETAQPGGARMAIRMGGAPEGFYTGRDGSYRIPFVSAGKYRVTVAKDGYGQESIEPVQIMDAGDVAANSDVRLSPGCSLAGRVVDAVTGAPLTQTFVQGRDGDGRPLLLGGMTVTDGDGRFRFTGLRPGGVSLTVHRPGYETWTGSANVNTAGEGTVTVPMKPEGE